MKKPVKKLNICSRGHKFYKSSDCPVCPLCWSGYYKEKTIADFPPKIGAPALRALLNAGITNLAQLAKYTKVEISDLHGMGPKALGMLEPAMKKAGFVFRKEK